MQFEKKSEIDPKLFWLTAILLLGLLSVLNFVLATLSWDQVGTYFSWIRKVKQTEDFKVRHFLQISPQIILISFVFYKTKWLSLKETLATALLFGLATGFTSELIQYFTPGRLFSPLDLVWNTLASLFGVTVFYLSLGFAKDPVNTRSCFFKINVLFFLITMGFLFFHSLTVVPFNGDDFKLLIATQNPQAGNFDYLKHILTTPTNGGVQYRPLSYYFSGIFLSQFFALSPVSTKWVAIFFLAIAAYNLFLFLRLRGQGFLPPLLTALLFLLGPWTVKTIATFRDHFKYGLNTVLLTFMLKSAYSKELNIKRALLFALLNTVAILNHEGACVWPVILCLFSFRFINTKTVSHYLILFLPSFIYLIARVFFWGIPRKGFMAVKIADLDDVFFHHFSAFFTFYYKSSYWLGLFFVVILIFLCIQSWKQNKTTVTIYTLSLAVLLFPFSLLDNHISKSHALWPAIFFCLISNELVLFFSGKLKGLTNQSALRFATGCLFLMFLFSTHFEIERYIDYSHQQMKRIVSASKTINNLKPDGLVELELGVDKGVPEYELVVSAAALSYYFPQRNFLLTHPEHSKVAYVENGYLYVYQSSASGQPQTEVTDIFGKGSMKKVPSPKGPIATIPALTGNAKENYHLDGHDVFEFDLREPVENNLK